MFDCKRHFDMDEFFQSRKAKWEDCEDESSGKERSSNQLLLFCDLILKYEKYKPHKEEMHDSAYSPSSSERSSDSYSSSESNSSFTSNRISSEDGKSPNADTDDESWDLITCHCMKPFAGRPMIECTMCETWIHMSCAKIRRNNIPDDFICQLCRESKGSKRRSERIRSDDRRLLA